jgi:hypothetical protein
MTPDEQALVSGLKLAAERVTADTIAEKQRQKAHLKDLVSRVMLQAETGSGGPSAAELKEALGEQAHRYEKVLERWGA